MILFRLGREKYANSLSGAGAARKGARWNSPGVEIIYCASSRALAMAEVVVHLTAATVPDDYMMTSINAPEKSGIQRIYAENLTPDWNVFPFLKSSRSFGDSFIRENKFLLLQVPSAVVKGDHNILINPFHRDFGKVKIMGTERFPLDGRLFH